MIRALRALIQAYEKRPGLLKLLPVLLWAAAIWWMSSRPGGTEPHGFSYSLLTNGAHVIEFGVLAVLIFLAVSPSRSWFRRLLPATVLVVLYGIVDELHQSQVKDRSPDLWDVVSDSLGAGVFVCGLLWLCHGKACAGWLGLLMLCLSLGSVYMAAS